MRSVLASLVSLVAGGITIVWLTAPLIGQAGQSPALARKPTPSSKTWTAKTAWGDPDLQGLWTNTTTTPLERLPEASDKQVLTDEERAALAQKVQERLDQDRARPGQVMTYNEFWYERGTLNNRTSLIINPPDGKLPAFTPSGQKRWDVVQANRKMNLSDSWLDRGAYDRCITRGMPGTMMPGFYNHNYHILQTPGYVTILVEMIHDARIIPLDGRKHLDGSLRQWLGDARGRWEGSTLVVETTNFNDKVFERGAAHGYGGNMRMIERFTRVDANSIDYQFTVEDPTTWTAPWTVSAPMVKTEGPIYEYACHEGNYAMTGILSGARAEEKAAAQRAKQP